MRFSCFFFFLALPPEIVEFKGDHENTEDNCCSDQITYFQNKINTVVQESFKLTFFLACAENFQLYSYYDVKESFETINETSNNEPPTKGSGSVLILIQSFLI